MPTLHEIEAALDAGRIELYVGRHPTKGERWWSCRRNGRTQTWKTKPGKFRIPIKAGWRDCSAITDASRFTEPGRNPGNLLLEFRIVPSMAVPDHSEADQQVKRRCLP